MPPTGRRTAGYSGRFRDAWKRKPECAIPAECVHSGGRGVAIRRGPSFDWVLWLAGKRQTAVRDACPRSKCEHGSPQTPEMRHVTLAALPGRGRRIADLLAAAWQRSPGPRRQQFLQSPRIRLCGQHTWPSRVSAPTPTFSSPARLASRPPATQKTRGRIHRRKRQFCREHRTG
jgi:hypothetical protein